MEKSRKIRTVWIIIAAVLLLFGAAWAFFWMRISRSVDQAAYEEAFAQFTFEGAHYTQCDDTVVQLYMPEVTKTDASLCGEQIGEMSIPTTKGLVTCPLFACKPLEKAGKENAVILLSRDGSYQPYELTGFSYLDDEPSIWAVCASYGIGKATDLESVIVSDAGGEILQTISDEKELAAFFEKFAELGECVPDADVPGIYLNSYLAENGDDGSIWLENGKFRTKDDEAYEKAMQFWSTDIRSVTVKVKNGLQLRGCIYSPKPGLFSVYGVYRFTEPFFESVSTGG